MESVSGGSGSSETVSAVEKKQERLKRLRELQLKRNEARKINHTEVVEEDKRNKEPKNIEAKRKRLEWEEEEAKKKKECIERGQDYERMKLLDTQADEADRIMLRKKKAKPITGFSTFEEMTARQNMSLTKNIKPDMADYQRKKETIWKQLLEVNGFQFAEISIGEWSPMYSKLIRPLATIRIEQYFKGDAFYANKDTLGLEEMHKDTEEGIDRMVDDLEKQIEKRGKYTRRRTHDEDADIDYINTRNAKFNQKLERFYGKYTSEIKQNLERGTAL